MRFILAMYGEQATWSGVGAETHADEMGRFARFEDEARTAGALRKVYALTPVEQGVIVRADADGRPVPSAGTVGGEQLGACYELECDSLEAAVDWAERLPLIGKGGFSSVEVRPVLADGEEGRE